MALSPASWGTGGGGGGGVPAGNDGEIQFNDAGAFGASSDFVWDDIPGGGGILKLVAAANQTAEIQSVGAGTQIQINASDGDATYGGSAIAIGAGFSDDYDGGEVSIRSGDAVVGSGGALLLDSGQSSTWDGGDINIRANGNTQAGNRGGDVNVHAGNGAVHGGNLVLQAGPSDGNVQMYAGDTSQAIQLDNTGLNVLATKVGFFGVAPVVQPPAPVTIFDVIAALKALGLVAT